MPTERKAPRLTAPSPSRQLAFHKLLVSARSRWLVDALQQALASIDPVVLKAESSKLVPVEVQKLLATKGIRDEFIFPLPVLIRQRPELVGYYRLLLGVPQKTFYSARTGMGPLKALETGHALGERLGSYVEPFCRTMISSLAQLAREMKPSISLRDVTELQLLTLGSQFQGGQNNIIGQQATQEVFEAIAEIVRTHVFERKPREIRLRNSSKREVIILFGSDPDISVSEMFGAEIRKQLAIEIKGGTDQSNAHNRAGEAEKSHLKAKRKGFRDFWTLITKASGKERGLSADSPTTRHWFDIAQILNREGEDWTKFQSQLCGELGIEAPTHRAKRR